MFSIKRFPSFDAAKAEWEDLEKQSAYYPFQSWWYQKIFAESFCETENVYLVEIYDNERLLAIGGFERVGNKILFLGMKQVLGGQDLTDYGDLLFRNDLTEQQIQEVWEAIIEYFKQQGFEQLQLDFVRSDSPTWQVARGRWHVEENKNHALPATRYALKQEVAPYLTVPASWDEYLQSLGRKERHELRRKIKRLEDQHAFHFCSEETLEKDFNEFIRLHRLSDTVKEQFMSEDMKNFFWKLVIADKTNYRIDFCHLEMDSKQVASIMSFVGQGKALLYNSGFDPQYSYYSVGLILHSYLIKKSIEEKLQIHDFLRGNERYKYDLGAKDEQLYRIRVKG